MEPEVEFEPQLNYALRPHPRITSDNLDLCLELLDAPHNDPALLYEALRDPIRIPW